MEGKSVILFMAIKEKNQIGYGSRKRLAFPSGNVLPQVQKAWKQSRRYRNMIWFIVTVVIFIVILIILKSVLPMYFMHPLPSGKIEGTDIVAIKNRMNDLFFFPAKDEWIVMDAGSDAKAVMQEMRRLQINEVKVKSVFLTHTDYDHVASIPLFPNATIYLCEQEKQMVDGSTKRSLLQKNELPKLGSSNKIVWLHDGEIVNINGHKVRIIWAPGHTKGSAMYVVDEKYLFSGDAFRKKNGEILVHPYTMDKVQANKTIQSIKKELERYEKVFTAHYG